MKQTRLCNKCGLEITGKNRLRWGKTASGAPAFICATCRRQWDRERKRIAKYIDYEKEMRLAESR